MGRPLGSKNKSSVDMSLLSAEEVEEVKQEAAAEVAAEAKAAARKAYKAQLLTEEKQKAGIAEGYEDVIVDLAPYCDRILLDNHAFMQGQVYTVRKSVAIVMREAMQKTWGHQSEIDGKSENFYRRTRGQRVVPAGNGAAVVNTSQLLRA